MATFAVAACQETIEKGNQILDLYTQDGDSKKEDALRRIFSLAESEYIRGTHPALEPAIRTVDDTLDTLVKQINGIVAGQDSKIQTLAGKLEKALAEKNAAIEAAQKQTEAAQAKSNAAEDAVKQAAENIEAVTTKAKAEIDTATKNAATAIDMANIERDQAVREAEDARAIAAEKTASNELLIRQMATMESDIAAQKELRKNFEALAKEKIDLNTQLADMTKKLEAQKESAEAAKKAMEIDFKRQMETLAVQAELATERAVNAKEHELRQTMEAELIIHRGLQEKNEQLFADNSSLRAQLENTRSTMEAQEKSNAAAQKSLEAAYDQRMATVAAQTELAIERAVAEKEHELRSTYQDQLRDAEMQNARLMAQLETLQEQFSKLVDQQ